MALREQYGMRISTTGLPPKDYECAVGLLLNQLGETLVCVSMDLKSTVTSSPELRKFLVPRPRNPHEDSRIIRVDTVSILRDDYFLWVISQLIDEEHPLGGFPGLLHKLDRMMRNDVKQRRHVSPWVAGAVSKLALVYELNRQIALSHPGLQVESLVPDHILQADSKRRNEVIDRFQAVLMQAREDNAFAALGTPLCKFHYPSDKRQTAATTEAMRNAERYLDEFGLALINTSSRKQAQLSMV